MDRRLSRLLALLGFALAVAGCATPSVREVSAAANAQLKITNLTNYTWRVLVFANGTTPVRSTHIQRFGELELSLESGDYVIEQTLLDAADAPQLTRRFPMRFEAPHAYRWSLATLHSTAEDEAAALARKSEMAAHE